MTVFLGSEDGASTASKTISGCVFCGCVPVCGHRPNPLTVPVSLEMDGSSHQRLVGELRHHSAEAGAAAPAETVSRTRTTTRRKPRTPSLAEAAARFGVRPEDLVHQAAERGLISRLRNTFDSFKGW